MVENQKSNLKMQNERGKCKKRYFFLNFDLSFLFLIFAV